MPQKISDHDNSKPKTILFKGKPGVGKTIAAGSYPKSYILSTDRKVGSLKSYYEKHFPHVAAEIEYDFFSEFWDVYVRLEELIERCPYKTVVLDTLTSLSKMAMYHSMKFRPEERKDYKGKELGRAKGKLMLPEIEDYGAESHGLNQIIDKMIVINQRWNVHAILIAHLLVIEGKDKKGNTIFERTLWTAGKKIAAAIPGAFDEIYHFDVRPGFSEEDPTTYVVHTHYEGDDFARTSLPLPPMIDFTNKNFYEEVQKSLSKPI